MYERKKVALICGVTGQDGSYLADLLVKQGYDVWGSTRTKLQVSLSNLARLNVEHLVKIIGMDPENFRSVCDAIITSSPDEIYYLSGQSSVGLSFEQPAETVKSIVIGSLNILEACRLHNKNIRIYTAGSAECFGDTKGIAANENTPFNPQNPYAAAKASSYWLVRNYREAYGMFACTGILFNHESPLRPPGFVTQKIVQTAKRISQGSCEKLTLGRLDISRDWGWAPEYVATMWQMLQQNNPEDFVIASGQTTTLRHFVDTAFSALGLEWTEFVTISNDFIRPSDILTSVGDPSKAKLQLGWSAKVPLSKIVDNLIHDCIF